MTDRTITGKRSKKSGTDDSGRLHDGDAKNVTADAEASRESKQEDRTQAPEPDKAAADALADDRFQATDN